jgi:hypothetical protein
VWLSRHFLIGIPNNAMIMAIVLPRKKHLRFSGGTQALVRWIKRRAQVSGKKSFLFGSGRCCAR